MSNNITEVADNLGIYETAVVSVLLQRGLSPTDNVHLIQSSVEDWLENNSQEREKIINHLGVDSTNADVAEALDAGVEVRVVMEKTNYTKEDLDELSFGEG